MSQQSGDMNDESAQGMDARIETARESEPILAIVPPNDMRGAERYELLTNPFTSADASAKDVFEVQVTGEPHSIVTEVFRIGFDYKAAITPAGNEDKIIAPISEVEWIEWHGEPNTGGI